MEISEEELKKQLVDAGNKLLSPPSSVSDLLESLHLVESLLLVVEQSPSESIREALASSTKALIAEELLRHSDDDVKVAVASCISEITRITAPEAPYADDEMKEVFQLIVSCLEKLDDKSSRSYIKRISILETLARVRSCVVMLDLECDDLIVEMFRHFLRTIRDDHHDVVFSTMETIMTLVFEESEAISVDLLSSILNILKKENKEVLPIARLLGEKVIVNCASKVKPYLLSAVRSSGASLDDYSKAVADICQAGDEAVELNEDVAKRNSGDETNLVKAPSEKAVEVAIGTMEDAPPSEEVGPSTVGSPTPTPVMSNGILKKSSEDTPATTDNSKEADNSTQDDKAEPSKAKVESVADEEAPKSKPQNSNMQKGGISNSTKSSESLEPILSDRKSEVIDTHEHEKNEAKDVDDIAREDTAIDTIVAANTHEHEKNEAKDVDDIAREDTAIDTIVAANTHEHEKNEAKDVDDIAREDTAIDTIVAANTHEHEKNEAKDVDDIAREDTAIDTIVAANTEKSLEEPILSPIASDNAHVDSSPASPTGSFVDETLCEQLGLGKKKEHPIQENESASDVDSKKESDSQQDSEGATGLESTLNKHASKKPSSASDQEEREADSANNTKKKGANIIELDGNSAKEVVQEAEVGCSQRVNKKKQGQTKATPAKGHSKTPAKGDKKTVAIPKPTPKSTKDGSGKSSSKRKYPSEENARQINVNNQELVGAKIEVWWPEDKKFYKGVVKSFDAAEKEHKIVYDDGDVELLKLKNEKWKFVGEHEGHGSDGESPDESADEMPIGKKIKTSADLGAKQGKTVSSAKMSGASSSKSKSALKSGKAKEEAPKKIGKSVSKASKYGNKFSDDTSKSAKKSKHDDEDSPKGSVKSKQGTSAKSKGKLPKSVGKSNLSTSGKVKASTLSMDEDTEDDSSEPEKSKGKSQSTKSQKNSNKRKRSMKV
ncbi:uncharacterized protein LOC141612224 isoform X2 [Silene latifolia]|uniref:uncharacterized protein LOC141612224 isoform X2 n=1 Tax=Silene latifolia TaxID=37657 RepID=UPI003D78ACE7